MKTLDYFENRAWKDEATACWNWALRQSRNGYGQFRDGGRLKKAHRGAWEAVNGPIPEGLHVLHRCDNPQCVNPEHLFTGTHTDNMRDMTAKGRGNHHPGSQNGMSKLTEHDVSIIKMLLNLGVKQHRIVTLYDGSRSGINHINTGRRWAHVAPLEMTP